MPARPGRDPAAERGVLERLREVAQREAVLSELLLERGPGRPRLDARRPRERVDLEHPVERAEVHRHRRPVAGRLDAADDARAAAVRDRDRARVLAPGEHALEVGLVRRTRDHVRRRVEAAPERPDDVAVGLSVRVRRARVGVRGTDVR